MSRQEVAEAVNAWLWEHQGRRTHLDSAYIGKLERGEHRWPVEHVRAGLRGVFGVDDDASLGLYVIYGLGRSTEAVRTVTPLAQDTEPAPTPSASPHDDAEGAPTVHVDVAAGMTVLITVDGERAEPVRVLLTTVSDDDVDVTTVSLTSGNGARVYSLADGRQRASRGRPLG